MAHNHSSHLVKHAVEKEHFSVWIDNFKVIGIGYHNNSACMQKKNCIGSISQKEMEPWINS